MKLPSFKPSRLLLRTLPGLLVATPLHAGTTTWTWNSAASGTAWSAASWTKSPAGGPATPSTTADDLRFHATGKTAYSVAGNEVDQSFTLGSLAWFYEGSGASDWQVTQISTGSTLTLSGANASGQVLSVGASLGTSANPRHTQARVFGAGALVLNNAAADVKIANKYGISTLDLSGLARFEATTREFIVGGVATSVAVADGAGSIGYLSLAQESTITTSLLAVGNNAANLWGLTSELELGATTVLNAGEIRIGSGGSNYSDSKGKVSFQSSVVGQEATKVTIRGATGGESRATLRIGEGIARSTSQALMEGALDLTGGEVDARLGEVTIGLGNGSGALGAVNAIFKMDRGEVDALSVLVGASRLSTLSANEAAVGTLSVAGGVFRSESMTLGEAQTGARQAVDGRLLVSGGLVEVADGVTVGRRLAVHASAPSTASVALTGGTLRVLNGNVAEGGGTVSSSLTLEGGTLDLNGHEAEVDTLAIRNGTLRNVGGIRSSEGEGFTKTTAGVLVLEGENTYTGLTTVAAGALRVSGVLSQSAVTLAAGARLEGGGTLGGAVGGSGTIDPGNSPGVLTLGQVDPSEGLGFNFEFSEKNAPVNWALPGNDVLRLTDATPLTSALGSGNTLSLFLSADLYANLEEGDTLLGGFLADTGGGLQARVGGASFRFYYEDAGGSFSYNGLNYTLWSGALFELSTVGDAHFTPGGMLTQFTVVPEPGSFLLCGMGAVGFLAWRRRRARKG